MQPHETQSVASAPRRFDEEGYLLLGLLFLVAILTIGLAIAAPKIGREIQRQKEIETIHRGEQYKRAIQLYYRKYGRYPMTLDQLKKTDNIRFLRQEYIDPMTGKKDWKLLHLGQVRMQAMGLFGQPMGGTAGGAVPGMPGSGIPAANMPGAAAATLSSSNTTGDDNFFNNSTNSNGSSGSSNQPANGTTPGNDQTTADNNSGMDSNGFGSSNSGFGGPGGSSLGSSPTTMYSGGGLRGSPIGSPAGATPAGSMGSGGMFGDSATGAPIVGVTVPLKKKSMLSYRKKTVYDQWQFVYNPQEDMAKSMGQSGGTPGTPMGNSPNGSPFGQTGNPSSSPFGSSGGIGGSGIGGSGMSNSPGSGGSFGGGSNNMSNSNFGSPQ